MDSQERFVRGFTELHFTKLTKLKEMHFAHTTRIKSYRKLSFTNLYWSDKINQLLLEKDFKI